MIKRLAEFREEKTNAEDEWVYFDADDVLTKTSVQIERAMFKLTGMHLPWTSWTDHDFVKKYNLGAERIPEMLAIWREERILERAEIYAGAREAMERVVDSKRKVGVITARGWHEKGREITAAMIEAERLPVSDLMVIEYHESKAELLEATGKRIAGFADDTVRHVHECSAKGIPAVLVSHPWNHAAPNHLPRIDGIGLFPEWIDRHERASALRDAPSQKRRPKP
jgi:hypothetical protein